MRHRQRILAAHIHDHDHILRALPGEERRADEGEPDSGEK
jgi:hypothetical protein